MGSKLLHMGNGHRSLAEAFDLLTDLWTLIEAPSLEDTRNTYTAAYVKETLQRFAETLMGHGVAPMYKGLSQNLSYSQVEFRAVKYSLVSRLISLIEELSGIQQCGVGPDILSKEAYDEKWFSYELGVIAFLADLKNVLTSPEKRS